MKKTVSILLALCIMLGMLTMTASAESMLPGDVNADGKVTPYDALLVQAHLHGELTLTAQQIETAIAACPSIDTLSTAHIVSVFFKPLVGQSKIAPEEDGLFHIRTAEDMALLHSFPYGGFSLDADIDMEGQSYTPMTFHGVFLGNGHTIANLSVTAPTTNLSAGALFIKVGSASNPNAGVYNLTLANPQLTTAERHQYAGLVCGSNYGSIQEVSIAGGTVSGKIDSQNAVGAMTGMNYGTVVTNGSVECNISYPATTVNGFVGANQSGATAAVLGAANLSQGQSILYSYEIRDPVPMDRQAVVDKVYAMSQVKWRVQEASLFKESDFLFKTQTGRTYTGFPYSHALGTLENFEYNTESISSGVHYLNNNYTYYVEGTESSSAQNTPEYDLILGHVMGADCSSAVASGWRTVLTTATMERTSSFVPSPANCAKYGIRCLANVELTNGIYTVWDANFAENSKISAENASQRNYLYLSIVSNADGSINYEKLSELYEGYARCQKGDMIDFYIQGYINSDNTLRSGAGHARLVAEDAHVVRDGSGKIDPVNSYLVTIEQGAGNLNSKNSRNSNQYSTWGVNCKYTFQRLAGIELAQPTVKNYDVYVPVTSLEYNNPYRAQTTFKLVNSFSPLSGVVSSNYGIVYTDVTIDGVSDRQFTGQYGRFVGADQNKPVGYSGTPAQYDGLDDSGFTSYKDLRANSTGSYAANRFLYKSVNLAKHAPQFASLPAGTHTYTIEVRITTGETKIYSGTFTTN